MMLKKVAKETVIYTFGNYIVRGCAYFLLLLRIHMLPPSAFSIITEFYSYIALGQVFYAAMDMTYCRFIYTLGKQHAFNAVITITLLISVLLSFIVLISIPYIAYVTRHLSHIRFFYYVVWILPLEALLFMAYARLRVEQQTTRFLLVKFVQAAANVVFAFILLYFPRSLTLLADIMGASRPLKLCAIDAVFIANLASSILALSCLWSTFKEICLVWKPNTARLIGRYASNAFFTALFLRLNDLLPLLLFRKLVPYNFYRAHTTEEILGSFATSCKLTVFITLVIQAFKYALEPFLFAYSDRKEAPKLYSQVMHLFVLLSCLVLLLLSVNIDWIVKIFIPNARYRYTVDTIPYLAFIHIVLGIYCHMHIAFKIGNRAQYIIWISLCGTLITGISLFLLVPGFGHWGCIYASIVGAVVMVALGYSIGQKYYPIPYSKQVFLLLVLTFLVIGKLPLWVAKWSFIGLGWTYIGLNAMILVVFCTIVAIWHSTS